MPQSKIPIVGVAPGGPSGLSPEVCQTIGGAEMVFGGERLLGMFPSLTGEKIPISNNLPAIAVLIAANLGRKRMVVLASGDPGFYGIASYLTGKLGKDVFEIVPGVSAMQLAFARIGENWDDAVLTSVHSRPIEDIISLVRSNDKVGILTDERHTPAQVATVLLEHGIDNCRAYVCQNLGTEEESIVATDLNTLKSTECAALNVVILLRDNSKPGPDIAVQPVIGSAEECFVQPTAGKLITKLEVRAISLAKLSLTPASVVWDIGAGSGAVSLEASQLAIKGRVFAIEKNSSAVAAINENVKRFGRHNVTIVHALAPDKLEELPAPDAVFVGGSDGKMVEILGIACRHLKTSGRIVINAATLETLNTSVDGLKANGFDAEVVLVNVARSKGILDLTRFEALNPVFVVTGWRGREETNS